SRAEAWKGEPARPSLHPRATRRPPPSGDPNVNDHDHDHDHDHGGERTVYRFAKNSREEVRASLTTYRGHRLADIRVYAADDDGDGDHPTRKGIAVRVRDLPRLREAVEALIAEAGEAA